MNPIKLLHESHIKSDYLFWGGFFSIGLALAAWITGRKKDEQDGSKPKADRTGIFLGHWVPSFFALGVALQHYEDKHFKGKR